MAALQTCQCGCGEPVGIARQTQPKYGHVKGQPYRFKGGHQRRLLPTHYYKAVRHGNGSALVHRLRAERALGKPLPPKAEVHHADGSISVEAPLVICPSRAYHMFLHVRMRVKAAGGDPNRDRVCGSCGGVKPIGEFVKNTKSVSGVDARCKACLNAQRRARREVA